MNPPSMWIVLGAVITVLCHGPGSLRAQATQVPITSDGDDRPWNTGVARERREAARDVFLEGNRLFRVPLFAQAADKYEAALGIWKHPAFYFNLALAQLNLGRDVDARENLERALLHGEEPLGAEQFEEARRQLRDIERQLGQIHVTCHTAGAEVTLDGTTLFTGPGSYRGWAQPKAHEVSAKKANYLADARRVTVTPGALQEVELKLVTLSEAADANRRWTAWKPWSVVAAGLVVAASGGVLHVLSARNFNAYDTRFLALPCVTTPDPMSPGCTPGDIPPDLSGQLSRARQQQAIAVGGYVAGGALIATGAVLVYMNRPRLQESPSASASTIQVVPIVSGDALGVLVSVSR